jgi:hypothetical protein
MHTLESSRNNLIELETCWKSGKLQWLILHLEGEVVAAFSSSIPYVQDPYAAEAVAVWMTVISCCDRGI